MMILVLPTSGAITSILGDIIPLLIALLANCKVTSSSVSLDHSYGFMAIPPFQISAGSGFLCQTRTALNFFGIFSRGFKGFGILTLMLIENLSSGSTSSSSIQSGTIFEPSFWAARSILILTFLSASVATVASFYQISKCLPGREGLVP